MGFYGLSSKSIPPRGGGGWWGWGRGEGGRGFNVFKLSGDARRRRRGGGLSAEESRVGPNRTIRKRRKERKSNEILFSCERLKTDQTLETTLNTHSRK